MVKTETLSKTFFLVHYTPGSQNLKKLLINKFKLYFFGEKKELDNGGYMSFVQTHRMFDIKSEP